MYDQRHYEDGSALPFRNQGIAGRAPIRMITDMLGV